MSRTEVRLSQVVVAEHQDEQLMELTEFSGSAPRTLSMMIGSDLARVIADRARGARPPRPMTHDLTLQILQGLSGSIEEIEIHDVNQGTYLATLGIRRGDGSLLPLDARPSDAVALALGSQAKIYVHERVWKELT